jgi:transcription elongation factor Elf1
MVKTTIDIPDELWKEFSIKVIQDYGGRKKNDIIQSLIEFFLGSHYTVICKNCGKEIDLTEQEKKHGVKLDVWGSLLQDLPEVERTPQNYKKNFRFDTTCPVCNEKQNFRLGDVRPIYEGLKKQGQQETHRT